MFNIKGILFDLDGTVLDSEGLFEEAQILLLKEYGIFIDMNELPNSTGMSYKEFYPQFMREFQLSDDIENLRLKLRTYLHTIMESRLKFIDGFETFYKNCIKHKGIKSGIVTNTTRVTYQKVQRFTNIDDYFNFSITATESIKPKPSSSPYLQAMEELSLKPYETVVIEDSKTGIISGLQSKAKVIAITTSLKSADIHLISDNVLVFKSYDEISNYFKKTFNIYQTSPSSTIIHK